MSKIKLINLFFALLTAGLAYAQCPPATAPLTVDFKWSTAAGSGNELARPAAHGTQTGTYSVNGYTVIVNVKDPNNRLAINNYTADPLIAANGPYTYCYAQTNGSLGQPASSQSLYSGYYMLGMFSANGAEKTEVEYIFSTPVYLCNFEISDIDYDGTGASTPGTNYRSYQDEVDVTAVNGSTNVPITITKAAAFTEVTVTGQNILANWTSENDGDVSASSNFGKVFLTTANPITKLTISYSNGPQDDGASNDHHIRLSGALGAASTTTLPVSIVNFDARHISGVNQATLTVANQVNVDRYELQRSTDAVNFSTITTARATTATQYSFTDAQPVNGSNYYRVKAVDRNGAISYSTIVRVDAISKNNYVVFGQGGAYTLQANTNTAKRIGVTIQNAAGAVISSQELQVSAGASRFSLSDLQNQASGLYFITVTENGSRVFSTKIAK